MIFFNFGFQVHEKAFIKISLLSIVVYIYSNQLNLEYKNILNNTGLNKITFKSLVYIGILAQMPLIHTPKDYLSKLFIVLSYFSFFKMFLNFESDLKNKIENLKLKFLNNIINIFLLISILLDLIIVLNPLIEFNKLLGPNLMSNKSLLLIAHYKEKFMFLPLMLFSLINSFVFQNAIALYAYTN